MKAENKFRKWQQISHTLHRGVIVVQVRLHYIGLRRGFANEADSADVAKNYPKRNPNQRKVLARKWQYFLYVLGTIYHIISYIISSSVSASKYQLKKNRSNQNHKFARQYYVKKFANKGLCKTTALPFQKFKSNNSTVQNCMKWHVGLRKNTLDSKDIYQLKWFHRY